MAIEVGKNRIEALGEVEESADLLRYYSQTMEDNDGYDHPMGNLGDATVHTRSILRPHGVFAVISPFNFPMALAAGPTGAALIAGNTVVLKPSCASPLSCVNLMMAYIDAGVPKGVVNLVMGPGDTVGQALQDHPGIDGIVFTGSYDVGMRLLPVVHEGLAAADASSRWAARTRRSCRATPTSTRRPRGSCAAPSASAARSARRTRGSMSSGRSTTSSSGCSSRRPRRSPSATRSSARTGSARSSTSAPSTATRPRSSEARRDGTVFVGGEHLTDQGMDRGFYVEPTVVGNLPASHRLFRDELFAPFTAVAAVDSLDEAITLANDSVYGLTAGVYSEDQAEVQHFLDRDPGRRPVRQPAGRRDDRRVAGHPGVRRLEGQRLDRQGRAVDVLRRAVPARAEPNDRRLEPAAPPRPRGRRPNRVLFSTGEQKRDDRLSNRISAGARCVRRASRRDRGAQTCLGERQSGHSIRRKPRSRPGASARGRRPARKPRRPRTFAPVCSSGNNAVPSSSVGALLRPRASVMTTSARFPFDASGGSHGAAILRSRNIQTA